MYVSLVFSCHLFCLYTYFAYCIQFFEFKTIFSIMHSFWKIICTGSKKICKICISFNQYAEECTVHIFLVVHINTICTAYIADDQSNLNLKLLLWLKVRLQWPCDPRWCFAELCWSSAVDNCLVWKKTIDMIIAETWKIEFLVNSYDIKTTMVASGVSLGQPNLDMSSDIWDVSLSLATPSRTWSRVGKEFKFTAHPTWSLHKSIRWEKYF
jgi:hypothetical protein